MLSPSQILWNLALVHTIHEDCQRRSVEESNLALESGSNKMTSLTHRDGEVSVSGSSEDGDFLDLADDEGWEDLEPDVEIVKVVCLMCNTVFDGVKPMVQHCKHTHGLDIVDIQKKFSAQTRFRVDARPWIVLTAHRLGIPWPDEAGELHP